MKKLFLLLAITHSLIGHDATHLCAMVGSIIIPTTARPPQLIGYYRGMKIDVVDGSYQVPICQGSDTELYLLATLGPFRPVSIEDVNTVSHFCLADKVPYKCYRLRKNPAYLGWIPSYAHPRGKRIDQAEPWLIDQIEFPANNRCTIPDAALLFLIDPQAVEAVENESWQTQGNTSRLPRIVLKKLSKKAMHKMVNEAVMASLDLEPFHRKPRTISQAGQTRPAFTELVMVTEQHETHNFSH